MDVAETVLNLRDVRPAMQIWIIDNERKHSNDAAVKHAVSDKIPEARVVSVTELKRHFRSEQKSLRRKSRASRASINRKSQRRK